MKTLMFRIYSAIPSSLKKWILISHVGRGLTDLVLGKGNHYRQIIVDVGWPVKTPTVFFKFCGSYKMAQRATQYGIENTLLRESINALKHNGMATGASVLDVGANYGFLSLVWADTVAAKGGKVIAFEPHPGIAACINRSVEVNNFENIAVENVAVGDRNDEIDLHLYSQTSNVNARGEVGHNVIRRKRITLDSYLKQNPNMRCDLMKIDVDGSEMEVLQGAERLIRKFRPILVVETNNDRNIITWVQNLHYKVYDMDLKPWNGEAMPVNIFCFA